MGKDINWRQVSSDRKVLMKNSHKIMNKLLKGYGFTPKEIDDINSRYHEQTEYNRIMDWLQKGSDRECLLADIYFVVEIDNLERVNDIMNGNVERLTDKDMHIMKILGLSEQE